MFERLKNLWKMSAYNFEQATKDQMVMYDAAGNKVELKKTIVTMKKKPATIIQDKKLEESIIDEGGNIE